MTDRDALNAQAKADAAWSRSARLGLATPPATVEAAPEYRFFFEDQSDGRYDASGADDTEAAAKVQAAFGVHPFDLTLTRTVPVTPAGLAWDRAIPAVRNA